MELDVSLSYNIGGIYLISVTCFCQSVKVLSDGSQRLDVSLTQEICPWCEHNPICFEFKNIHIYKNVGLHLLHLKLFTAKDKEAINASSRNDLVCLTFSSQEKWFRQRCQRNSSYLQNLIETKPRLIFILNN